MKHNKRSRSIECAAVMAMSLFLFVPAGAQEIPKEYQDVITTLGRKGDFSDNVLKVNVPRNDLRVTVAGVSTPTSFGFGGWLGFTKGDEGMDVMMGDLVLLQEEVNPVMSALLSNGLEVTALHNHFFWEEPRIFYMHVHGHGKAAELAKEVKPALDLIGHIGSEKQVSSSGPREERAQSGVSAGKLDSDKLNSIIGHRGDFDGHVYKVTIGRPDLVVSEMGARIGSRMGLNSWAAIVGSDEQAAIAGDIAMRESEVNPVLKALRASGLDVVAIHHHMIASRPMIIFLHYWGTGQAAHLAEGFKAALAELGKKGGPNE